MGAQDQPFGFDHRCATHQRSVVASAPSDARQAWQDRGMTQRTIADNAEASRYELLLDGALSGVVEYQVDGDTMMIPHVEVVAALRGKGYSAPFLDDVLELIRARGLKVIPLCGYARGHIQRRPDLHDLVAH